MKSQEVSHDNIEIIIPNQEKFKKTVEQIKSDGFEKLHVLSDFDRTLTYGTIDGQKTPSIISMLRDGNHLTADYAAKAHALFDKYHPIEVDSNISLQERKQAMQEWWQTHNQLLVESGLAIKDLEDIVKNGQVKFRAGVTEFLDFLDKQKIPLVILSSSGAGDAIRMFFQQAKCEYSNIYYVTNQFNWDNNGKAIGTKGKVIHCLNKDETVLEEIPGVNNIIEERKNIILLGDSVADLGMVAGVKYDNLLKIGFLNFDYNLSREEFKQNFDVVLEGDGNFSFVNSLFAGF